jgi:AraC-like DNA-binding protein
MPGEAARQLARRARELPVDRLFGKPAERSGAEQREAGVATVHQATLGENLSYDSVSMDTGREGGVLGVRAENNPLMFCLNRCERTVLNYTEGLPVSPYHPGEALLHPLSIAAVYAPPGTRVRFNCIFVARNFIRPIAEDAGLPERLFLTDEPWLLTTRLPASVRQTLSRIEGCPLRGGLRRLYFEAEVLEIMALLLTCMVPASNDPPAEPPLRPRDVRKVHEARDLIDSRLDDLPSLSELARMVGMSATALKKAYRTVFGEPVYEHARNGRLALARTLLAEGELSVSEVADRVGYQSLSWFSVAFKRQFGILPSEVWPRTVKEMSSAINVTE